MLFSTSDCLFGLDLVPAVESDRRFYTLRVVVPGGRLGDGPPEMVVQDLWQFANLPDGSDVGLDPGACSPLECLSYLRSVDEVSDRVRCAFGETFDRQFLRGYRRQEAVVLLYEIAGELMILCVRPEDFDDVLQAATEYVSRKQGLPSGKRSRGFGG